MIFQKFILSTESIGKEYNFIRNIEKDKLQNKYFNR